MSGEELHPDERAALERIGRTPVPAPSAAARERARAAFLHGHVEDAPRISAVSVPPAPRVSRLRTLATLAAAAAVGGLLWFGGQPLERWTAVETRFVTLDEEQLDDGDGFAHGTVATAGTGSLEATLGGTLRISVPAGSRVELPPAPGRWYGNDRLLRVDAGELFATTGGRPLGFALVIETPDTRTRILGTTFAVRRNDLGTCICLWEGHVETVSLDGVHAVRIPPGRRVQFYGDGLPPTFEPLSPLEDAVLRRLHEAASAPTASGS